MNKKNPIKILDVNIHQYTMKEIIAYLTNQIIANKKTFVVTANAEIVMLCQNDLKYKNIVNLADIVLPDGAGTVWAGNFLGHTIKERVAGFDLFLNLLKVAVAKNFNLYFLGSSPGIAKSAKDKLLEKYPTLSILGYHDGYFNEEEELEIIKEINNSNINILLVALGAPKQELWIDKHLKELNVNLVVGVGGSFDVIAGKMQRAPKFMQEHSLEWLFRLYKQPNRFLRMLVLPKFVIKVLYAKLFND